MSDFVKAQSTSTTVEESQGQIIAMLHRYGASGFGFRRLPGDIHEVRFHLPTQPDRDLTVAIPVNVSSVHARLNAAQAKIAKARHRKPTVERAQAERVAWRILYLWIDAALAAVSIGAQSIEEAFFAHLIVETTEGEEGRLADYIATLQRAASGSEGRLPTLASVRRLLGPGVDR